MSALTEWQERMQEPIPLEESSFSLSLIIEHGAVCRPCRDDQYADCTGEARDVIAQRPIRCHCAACFGFKAEVVYLDTPSPSTEAGEGTP